MKTGFRALSLIVFATGFLTYSLALTQSKSSNDMEPSRSFLMVSYLADATPDGKKTITTWRTRYVKENGEFRVVTHGSDEAAAFAYETTAAGTSSTVLAGMTEGVFVKPAGSAERKSLVSPSAQKSWDTSVPERLERQFHSHSFLRNHPEFERMDKVAGLEVYVLKTLGQGFWVENSYSPSTGRTPLRSVLHQLDGTEYITETVKVDFRDVPENLNDDIKTLPTTGQLGDKTTPPKNHKSN